MKLSFCVPVYNRARCLGQCLESLMGQTMSPAEYEIIVADDCSTDGSAQAAVDLFAAQGFANGVVRRLDVNSGGASTPRNEAIRLARGEYLFFVDSDDYVAADLAERVYAWATLNDADVVYVKYGEAQDRQGDSVANPQGMRVTLQKTDDPVSRLEPPRAFAEHGDIPRADIVDDKLLYATMVHKAFRRARWLELDLQFDPGIRVYEDLLVTVQFLFAGPEPLGPSRCAVLADRGYYFLVNRPIERLHEVDEPLEVTFGLYSKVLDTIVHSRHWDETYRARAAAVIINRIMRFGPVASHPYLEKTCPPAEARQWLTRWQTLLARHFPTSADRFISPDLRNHVKALRRGNLTTVRAAVRVEQLRRHHLLLGKILRRGLGLLLGLS